MRNKAFQKDVIMQSGLERRNNALPKGVLTHIGTRYYAFPNHASAFKICSKDLTYFKGVFLTDPCMKDVKKPGNCKISKNRQKIFL